MSDFLQDLHYGFRVLIRNPLFTTVAILTLALGIGASSAVFTAVNGILLRPLPFGAPDQLVWLANVGSNSEESPVSPGDFSDWRRENQVFQEVGAFIAYVPYNISGGDLPEQVKGVVTTTNLFPMLGVKPRIGNTFPEEASQPGRGRIALISDRLWKRRFGADSNIVGQNIILNGQTFSVAGVMPADFRFPIIGHKLAEIADIWAPLPFNQQQMQDRGTRFFSVIGRLKPGTTTMQAQANMNTLAEKLGQMYPATNAGQRVKVTTLHEHFVGDTRPALVILLGAVGFVLLIACANVANLLLARIGARQREIAIRVALGAGRSRLIRQFLTESLALALVGGLLGLLLAYLGILLTLKLGPSNIPRLQEVHLNPSVLAFTLSISAITTIFFGLAPALKASKANPNENLKEGGASSINFSRHWTRSAFVISEMALTLALLVGAGLSLRSFLGLIYVDPGLNADNVVIGEIPLTPIKYLEAEKRAGFYQRVLQQAETLPGVEAVSLTDSLPFTGADLSTSVEIEGEPKPRPGEEKRAGYRVISPNYFRTMGIPFMRGRDFSQPDSQDGMRYVIVNQAFIRQNLPPGEAIGKRFTNGYEESGGPREIIGVVGDVKHFGLDEEAKPEIYVPYLQNPGFFMYLAVRDRSAAKNAIGAIRNVILSVDKGEPLANTKTMESIISDSVAAQRMSMVLLLVFGALALGLAAVGIYSTLASLVIERTLEIGIRMALGAQRGDIIRLILKQGMRLVAIGAAIGLLGAFMLTKIASNLLYGVKTSDPGALMAASAMASALLVLVALIACYLSAHKAARLDPLIAIKYA